MVLVKTRRNSAIEKVERLVILPGCCPCPSARFAGIPPNDRPDPASSWRRMGACPFRVSSCGQIGHFIDFSGLKCWFSWLKRCTQCILRNPPFICLSPPSSAPQVGLSLGGLAAAVAGAVCVEYADRAGAVSQEVILPEQIPRLIQSG